MIRINQIKILHDENQSYDHDSINAVLRAKAAKMLRISSGDIESFEKFLKEIDKNDKEQ